MVPGKTDPQKEGKLSGETEPLAPLTGGEHARLTEGGGAGFVFARS